MHPFPLIKKFIEPMPGWGGGSAAIKDGTWNNQYFGLHIHTTPNLKLGAIIDSIIMWVVWGRLLKHTHCKIPITIWKVARVIKGVANACMRWKLVCTSHQILKKWLWMTWISMEMSRLKKHLFDNKILVEMWRELYRLRATINAH